MAYQNPARHPVVPTASTVHGEEPTPGGLANGEIGVNSYDGKIFIGAPDGGVRAISSSPVFPSAEGFRAAALIPTEGEAIMNGLSGTLYGSDSVTPGGNHSDEQRMRDGIHWAQTFYSNGEMKLGQDAVDDWSDGVLYAYNPDSQALVSYNRGEACFLYWTGAASQTLSMSGTNALTGGTVEFDYGVGGGWVATKSQTYATAGYYVVKVRWTGGVGGGSLDLGNSPTNNESTLFLLKKHVAAVYSTGGKVATLTVGGAVNLSACCVFHQYPTGGVSNSNYTEFYQYAPYMRFGSAGAAGDARIRGRAYYPPLHGTKSPVTTANSTDRRRMVTTYALTTWLVDNFAGNFETYKQARLRYFAAGDFDSSIASESVDGGTMRSGDNFNIETFDGFKGLSSVPPNLSGLLALGTIGVLKFGSLVKPEFMQDLYNKVTGFFQVRALCLDVPLGSPPVTLDINQHGLPSLVYATSDSFPSKVTLKRTVKDTNNLNMTMATAAPFKAGGTPPLTEALITVPGKTPADAGTITAGAAAQLTRLSVKNELGQRLKVVGPWNAGINNMSLPIDFDAFGDDSPFDFLIPAGSSFGSGQFMQGRIFGNLYGKVHLDPAGTNYTNLFGDPAVSVNGILEPASYDSFLAWMRHQHDSGYFANPLTIGAKTAKYTAAGAVDRAYLVSQGWTIGDGGQA